MKVGDQFKVVKLKYKTNSVFKKTTFGFCRRNKLVIGDKFEIYKLEDVWVYFHNHKTRKNSYLTIEQFDDFFKLTRLEDNLDYLLKNVK